MNKAKPNRRKSGIALAASFLTKDPVSHLTKRGCVVHAFTLNANETVSIGHTEVTNLSDSLMHIGVRTNTMS